MKSGWEAVFLSRLKAVFLSVRNAHYLLSSHLRIDYELHNEYAGVNSVHHYANQIKSRQKAYHINHLKERLTYKFEWRHHLHIMESFQSVRLTEFSVTERERERCGRFAVSVTVPFQKKVQWRWMETQTVILPSSFELGTRKESHRGLEWHGVSKWWQNPLFSVNSSFLMLLLLFLYPEKRSY